VILGALLMLLSLVLGRGADGRWSPCPSPRWLQAAGPLAFALVGCWAWR
jgi:hypothetical protein